MKHSNPNRSVIPRERVRRLLERAQRMISQGASMEETRRKLGVTGHCWRQWLLRYPWVKEAFEATQRAILEERAAHMLAVARGEGLPSPLESEESDRRLPRDRLYLDTLRWMLERRVPERWGPRVHIESTSTRVDLKAVVAEARSRVLGGGGGTASRMLPEVTMGFLPSAPDDGPDDLEVGDADGEDLEERLTREEEEWAELLK